MSKGTEGYVRDLTHEEWLECVEIREKTREEGVNKV